MKIIVKISGLYLLLCSSILSAQDLQKWYADDIYYSSTEKETNVIEIVEYSEYDNEIDTLENRSIMKCLIPLALIGSIEIITELH